MSEVKSIDTGPEWILRVNGPGEPRCVAKRESEEQKPETGLRTAVCVTSQSLLKGLGQNEHSVGSGYWHPEDL